MGAVAERSFTLIQGSDDGSKITLADDVAVYLQHKRKRLTVASQRGYVAALQELVDYFPPDITLAAFEGAAGTRKVETFLSDTWGQRSGRTYNKNLSIVSGFFGWCHDRDRIMRDPTKLIEKAKERQFLRQSFSDSQHAAILEANPEPHDWLALRLLLDFGIRKGALQNVRFDDFDHAAQRLVIFTKGESIHRFPIPDDRFWDVLADHIGAIDAQPFHYLLPRLDLKRVRPAAKKELALLEAGLDEQIAAAEAVADLLGSRQARATVAHLRASKEWVRLTRDAATERIVRYPDKRIGDHGAHSWWYRCLTRAGLVAPGTTSGMRTHTARHTAAQRVLEATGNLKAAQALLGHSSSATTDAYVGWSTENLEASMRQVLNV